MLHGLGRFWPLLATFGRGFGRAPGEERLRERQTPRARDRKLGREPRPVTPEPGGGSCETPALRSQLEEPAPGIGRVHHLFDILPRGVGLRRKLKHAPAGCL